MLLTLDDFIRTQAPRLHSMTPLSGRTHSGSGISKHGRRKSSSAAVPTARLTTTTPVSPGRRITSNGSVEVPIFFDAEFLAKNRGQASSQDLKDDRISPSQWLSSNDDEAGANEMTELFSTSETKAGGHSAEDHSTFFPIAKLNTRRRSKGMTSTPIHASGAKSTGGRRKSATVHFAPTAAASEGLAKYLEKLDIEHDRGRGIERAKMPPGGEKEWERRRRGKGADVSRSPPRDRSPQRGSSRVEFERRVRETMGQR